MASDQLSGSGRKAAGPLVIIVMFKIAICIQEDYAFDG